MKGKQQQNTATTLPNKSPLANKELFGGKWICYLIACLTALIYIRALFNGITSNDDDFYIINNPYLRDYSWHGITEIFSSFYQSNYHPFTTLLYFVLYNIWGVNPLPYHALSVALHVINVLLVFQLVRQLSGRSITAIIVTTLFALHPMHVESVAWIAELKDVLYSSFYILALLAYLRYQQNKTALNYVLVFVLFILSLLSKPSAVTLPLILLLIDIYKGYRLNKSIFIEKIPFFVLALIMGVVNIYAQKAGGPVDLLFSRFGFINGIFLFKSGIIWYILHAALPYQLSAFHYFPEVTDGHLPWLYYLSVPALVAIIVLSLRIKRTHVLYREYWFGVAFFLLSISVMLQFLSVGAALTAERYTYLPYLGLFYILGQYISGLPTAASQKKGLGIIMALAVIFSFQTYNRIGVWQNDDTLFTDVIEQNAESKDINIIYLHRGHYKSSNQDYKGAIADYTKAIDLNPGFAFAANAFFSRGFAYDLTGNVKEAIVDYTHAIAANRTLAEPYNKRGYAMYRLGNRQQAVSDFDSAILLKPDYAEAYNNRGWLLQSAGNTAAALRDYDMAISIEPNFDKPYYNRAALKANAGDLNGVLADYAAILKLHPDDSRTMHLMGMTYYNINNKQQACALWQQAAQAGNQDAVQSLQQYCK